MPKYQTPLKVPFYKNLQEVLDDCCGAAEIPTVLCKFYWRLKYSQIYRGVRSTGMDTASVDVSMAKGM